MLTLPVLGQILTDRVLDRKKIRSELMQIDSLSLPYRVHLAFYK